MTPVEIEFLMRDKLTPGMEKAGKSADDLGQKAEQVSKKVKEKIEEQRKVIHQVEEDVKSLEKEYEKLAPGRAKMEMAAEISAAKKVLQEERGALEEINKEFTETQTKAKRLTTALREMQEELAKMRMEGKQGSVAYQELSAKAAMLADTLGDVRQETKILAHDDAGIQGVISGVGGLAGTITMATGVMGVFAREHEDLIRIQTKVQSVMAITMGLQQVMNTLNKDSQFRIYTLAKAKTVLSAANVKLATSLKISNTAAKALMIGGIGVLIVGVASLISWYEKLNAKKKENKAISKEVQKETQNELVKAQSLERILKDSSQGYDVRQKALKQLKEIMPDYNAMLDKEGKLIQDNTGSLKRYADQLKNTALAKIYSEKLAEAEADYSGWLGGLTGREKSVLLTRGIDLRKEDEFVYNVLSSKVKQYQDKINGYRRQLDSAVDGQLSTTVEPKSQLINNDTVDTIIDLEKQARKKIEDNAIALMRKGYERQRQEAALAFEREKSRITEEEKKRLELYEKLRKAGEPVTTEQKNTIISQSKQQSEQAKDSYEKTLADISASEKLEFDAQSKVIKDALAKYQTYYQERLSTIEKFQKDRDLLLKEASGEESLKGVLGEMDYQEQQALSAIDEKFAMREESFQRWANSIVNLSIAQLGKLLHEAEQELSRIEFLGSPDSPQLIILRAQIKKYQEEIRDKNNKVNTSPAEDSVKRWQDLQKVLNRCSREFETLGKETGGITGEILSAAGTITTSTLSMISSMTELSNWSVYSTKMAAEGASKAIIAVERASVILTIVSAAIQVMQQIDSLLPDAHSDYLKYAEKVNEINIMRDAVREYELAVLRAKHAEESWFSTNNLQSLRQAREEHDKIRQLYNEKALESQAIYQNKSGGGWITNAWNAIWDNSYGKIYGKFGREYEEGMTAAINNLRIETRKKSSGFLGSGIGGKSQKTEDLTEWVKQNLGYDLFDDSGLIDLEAAGVVLEQYGEKLVGQTKETLEALVELREQYNEYLEQLREYVSSLYEPLVDNFVSSLWDWVDNGKDALDSFKGYAKDTFRDIVSDMMRTIVLDKVVGNFSDDITALYEQYASKQIGETELMAEVGKKMEELMGNYETNLPVLQDIMNTINKGLAQSGIDLKEAETYSQSGRAGAITTITQDQGTKIEGIGNSIQMHTTNLDENVENMNEALGEALSTLKKIEEHTSSSSTTLKGIKEHIETIIRDGLKV